METISNLHYRITVQALILNGNQKKLSFQKEINLMPLRFKDFSK